MSKPRKRHFTPEQKLRRKAYAALKRLNNPEPERARGRNYNRTLEGLFNYARRKSKAKGISWTLTLEQFTVIRAAVVCTYCQFPLPEVGIGLDRLDNAKGYEPGNVAPCCTVCNRARSSHFTYEEMLELGKAIRAIRLRRSPELEKALGKAVIGVPRANVEPWEGMPVNTETQLSLLGLTPTGEVQRLGAPP